MAKDPAFLFYPGDWIGGTMGMSFEQRGVYITVLMLQFNNGHMTEDMIGQTVGHMWEKVKHKFIQDEKGLWYNERLEIEKEKRKNFVQSRRNNKLGNNQFEKKSGHMSNHMEDRNVNSIKNSNKVRGKEFIKNFSEVILENGEIQKLGNWQSSMAAQDEIQPEDILAGVIK